MDFLKLFDNLFYPFPMYCLIMEQWQYLREAIHRKKSFTFWELPESKRIRVMSEQKTYIPPIMSLVHFQFGNLIKCAKSLNSYSTWLGIELVSLSQNSRNLLCGILFLDTFTPKLNNSTKSNHFPFSFLCAIGIIRGESLNFSIFMAFLASMNFWSALHSQC